MRRPRLFLLRVTGAALAWCLVSPSGLAPGDLVPGAQARPGPGAQPVKGPSEGASVSAPRELPVPSDRALRVLHAPAELSTAIVYLHGMCGNPRGADPWGDLAARYGTVVSLRANVPCKGRPGFKWPHEPEAISARIDAALEVVRAERQGQLDTERVVLLGYSQGAHRAERLAARFPHRYRTLMLAGPPTKATPERLRHARRVAILGGELEDTAHMVDGFLALRAAGIESEFFLLPAAHHGSYGPQGRRVMGEVLRFLFDGAPNRSPEPGRLDR